MINQPFKHTCFTTFIGKCKKQTSEAKPLYHVQRNMPLTAEEIKRARESNLRTLLKCEKLHLLLDLDNTLIHAIRFDRLTSDDKTYLRYTQREIIDGVVNPDYIHQILNYRFAVKKRPGVEEFLRQLKQLFDISIYTLASKSYAKAVAEILDPYKCIFKDIFTSENCTSPGYKGLDVVLYPERVTLIVDDLTQVWRSHAENLIQIGGYEFFNLQSGLGIDMLTRYESSGCTCIDGMDPELSRVLMSLKKIHGVFYKEKHRLGLGHGDVRKMIMRDIGVFYKMEKQVFKGRIELKFMSIDKATTSGGVKFSYPHTHMYNFYISFL